MFFDSKILIIDDDKKFFYLNILTKEINVVSYVSKYLHRGVRNEK